MSGTCINEYMEQCDISNSEDGNLLVSDTNDSISVYDDGSSSVVIIDQVHVYAHACTIMLHLFVLLISPFLRM